MRLTFLGTGAAGGTPGKGRSRRRESSLLVQAAGGSVLLDAPAGVTNLLAGGARLDAVVLTHAHRDAAGGLAELGSWCRSRGSGDLRLLASPEALGVVAPSLGGDSALRPLAVEPGQPRRVAGLTLRAAEVPHARERRFRTFAWRLRGDGAALVYASDVARLETRLRRLCAGAELLVIDAALWRRALFSHLTIDRELPALCSWPVGRILLTQIGRSAPAHEQLERAVAELCPRAAPAWDGLSLTVGAAAGREPGGPRRGAPGIRISPPPKSGRDPDDRARRPA